MDLHAVYTCNIIAWVLNNTILNDAILLVPVILSPLKYLLPIIQSRDGHELKAVKLLFHCFNPLGYIETQKENYIKNR